MSKVNTDDENNLSTNADLMSTSLKNQKQPIVEGICGNLLQTAPEVIEQDGQDHKADVFSLGVLIFWLLTSEQPYEQLSESGRKFMTTSANVKYLTETMSKKRVPSNLSKLIKKMLALVPSDRIGIQQVIEDPWFKDMQKSAYKQQKQFLICEELENKNMIEKLLNIKFANKLGRLI